MEAMKLLMEGFNKFLTEQEELEAPLDDEKSMFMDNVKKLQKVLERHELGQATLGTYDPQDFGDSDAAWDHYREVREQVLEDPEYKALVKYFEGLKVKTDYDKILTISSVSVIEGEFEAGGAAYLILSDPDDLTKKGIPRKADSIMIEEDYESASFKVKEIMSEFEPDEDTR